MPSIKSIIREKYRDESSKLVYRIQLSYLESQWEVNHTRDEISKLYNHLCDNCNLSSQVFIAQRYNDLETALNEQQENEDESPLVEAFINSVLEYYNEDLWFDNVLIKFLKDSLKDSIVTTIQLGKMSSQIKRLHFQSNDQEAKLNKMMSIYSDLTDAIYQIKNSNSIDNNSNDQYNNNKYGPGKLDSTPSRTGVDNNFLKPGSENNNKNTSRYLYDSNSSSPFTGQSQHQHQGFASESPGYQSRNTRSVYQDKQMGILNSTSSHRSHPLNAYNNKYSGHMDSMIDSSSGMMSQSQGSNMDMGGGYQRVSKSNSGGAMNNGYPSVEIKLSPDIVRLFDPLCEEILKMCEPHEEQLFYRKSVTNLLKKHIRMALNATSVDISLQVIKCFLPDDVIKLSVIVSRSLPTMNELHNILVEQFTLLSEMGKRGIRLNTIDEETGEETLEEDPTMLNHVISNVNVTKHNVGFKLICTVDEYVDVEIVFNNRNDLCMLSFIEEVSELVGRQHLFKRSFMLIRTWWFYETSAYMGSSIKHYLSDFSLCVMITAIFNQHHSQISSPIEALCMFLNEYADYDGHLNAISLQGIIPFVSPTSNQPKLKYFSEDYLITPKIIDKYSQLFQLGQQAANKEQQTNDIVFANTSLSFKGEFSDDSEELYKLFQGRNSSKPFNCNKIEQFSRSTFNIIQPFSYTNMITVNLSHTRLMKLNKAFQIGKNNLYNIIKLANENYHNPQSNIKNFFSVTLTRFANNWRPDTADHLVNEKYSRGLSFDSPHLFTSLNSMWQNITFYNLIIDAILSESGLVTACVEQLSLKGPLPVGEIGKMISDAACMQNLSWRLKEKYGGLKRLLENYPDKFSFTKDHPFNPHVILKDTLTPEQSDMLEQGVLPLKMLVRPKKMALSVGKNNTTKQFSSGTEEDAYLYPGNSMPPVDDYGNSLSLSNSMGGFQSLDNGDNINVLNQNKTLSANAVAWQGPSVNPKRDNYPNKYNQQNNLSASSYSGLLESTTPSSNYLTNPNYLKPDDKSSMYRPSSLRLSSSYDSQLGVVPNSFSLSSLRDNSSEMYPYASHVDVSTEANNNNNTASYQTRGQIYGAPGVQATTNNTVNNNNNSNNNRSQREDNILDQIYFGQKNHSN